LSARIRPRSSCSGPPPVGSCPPPARARFSSISESSEQLPSIAPWWPHSESLGPGCATTWPAVCRYVALRSSIAGVAFRADGCLPSGGHARSESVSASCAMVGWALSESINWADRLAILTLDACHVQAPFQNGKAGAQSDSHIFANDGLIFANSAQT
jgi:hypothetical protein